MVMPGFIGLASNLNDQFERNSKVLAMLMAGL
jgi:hypothetical protein